MVFYVCFECDMCHHNCANCRVSDYKGSLKKFGLCFTKGNFYGFLNAIASCEHGPLLLGGSMMLFEFSLSTPPFSKAYVLLCSRNNTDISSLSVHPSIHPVLLMICSVHEEDIFVCPIQPSCLSQKLQYKAEILLYLT